MWKVFLGILGLLFGGGLAGDALITLVIPHGGPTKSLLWLPAGCVVGCTIGFVIDKRRHRQPSPQEQAARIPGGGVNCLDQKQHTDRRLT